MRLAFCTGLQDAPLYPGDWDVRLENDLAIAEGPDPLDCVVEVCEEVDDGGPILDEVGMLFDDIEHPYDNFEFGLVEFG